MADVAFVPERDVLHRGERITAEHAGKAGYPLAQFGVALVRHRTRAGLAFVERLLGLTHLGLLERPDFRGELFERGADEGESCDELCVPVTLDHLGRCRLDPEAQPLADDLFELGWDRCMGTDRAADGANGDCIPSGLQALTVASHLSDPDGELEPERRRLRVDPVRASDAQRVAVSNGLSLEHHREGIDPLQECRRRLLGKQTIAAENPHARRIGEVDDAAGATFEGLIRRGLLARGHRDDSRGGSSAPGFLQLTDQGAALLEQIEGVQFRLLDTLVEALGELGVHGLRTALRAITEVLNTVASHAGHLGLRAGPR